MTAGLICQDDINTVGHSLFNNFRKALINYFPFNFKNILNSKDLEGVIILFSVDEHYIPHVPIWKNEEFVDCMPNINRIEAMCKEYPGLAIAFEKFKTTYNIVKDDYDNPKDKK